MNLLTSSQVTAARELLNYSKTGFSRKLDIDDKTRYNWESNKTQCNMVSTLAIESLLYKRGLHGEFCKMNNWSDT